MSMDITCKNEQKFLRKHYVKLNIALIVFIVVVILCRLLKLLTVLAAHDAGP